MTLKASIGAVCAGLVLLSGGAEAASIRFQLSGTLQSSDPNAELNGEVLTIDGTFDSTAAPTGTGTRSTPDVDLFLSVFTPTRERSSLFDSLDFTIVVNNRTAFSDSVVLSLTSNSSDASFSVIISLPPDFFPQAALVQDLGFWLVPDIQAVLINTPFSILASNRRGESERPSFVEQSVLSVTNLDARVPLPGTIGLTLAGMAGLAVVARRRPGGARG